MSRFFAFTTGRRGKWVVLTVWLVVAIVIAPFAGKLESVEKNESSSFLPGNAESTKVLAVTTKFQGGDIASAVVIYRRAAGLTPADVDHARKDFCAIVGRKLPGVLPAPAGICSPGSAQPGATPQAGEQQQTLWVPPTLSPDQKAMIYGIPIDSGGGSQQAAQHLIDDVDAIRAQVGEGQDGLDVKVTGGAGFSADAVKIFNNIDSKLLYSTLLIVAILLLITYRSPVLWLIPLITVAFAEQCSRAVAYALAQAGVVINGETAGVLVVLVFGAGTDYALLIIARYREELRRHEDRHEAMAFAMRPVRARHPRVRHDRDRRPALPAGRVAEQQPRPRTRQRPRHRDRPDGHADAAAGDPGDHRPVGVLAVRPPLRVAAARGVTGSGRGSGATSRPARAWCGSS